MFSFVGLSFIIFTTICKTMQQATSISNSCFYFVNPKYDNDSNCRLGFALPYAEENLRCIFCEIFTVPPTLSRLNNCSRDYSCVSLEFDRNDVLEDFFKIYGRTLLTLFPRATVTKQYQILRIRVEFYFSKIINNDYIKDTFNFTSPSMLLWMRFQRTNNLTLEILPENRFNLTFRDLYIDIECTKKHNPGKYSHCCYIGR